MKRLWRFLPAFLQGVLLNLVRALPYLVIMWLGHVVTRTQVVREWLEKHDYSTEVVLVVVVIAFGFLWMQFDLRGIKGRMKSVLEIIKHIQNFLSLEHEHYQVFRSNSPLSLTVKGKGIAEQCNARKIAEKYAQQVEVDEAAKEYDIQVAAFDFAKNKLSDKIDEEENENIKKVAYNNAFKVDTILGVIGVVLRDYILEERGMSPEGVDKTNPRKQDA